MKKGSFVVCLFPLVLFALMWGAFLVRPAAEWHSVASLSPTGEPMFTVLNEGLVKEGSRLYGNLGCAECHTQVISGREKWLDAWDGQSSAVVASQETRVTLPEDYEGDAAAHFGSLRRAPDLSRLADRLARRVTIEDEKGNALRFGTPDQWLYLHLFNPRDPVFRRPWSVCPAMPFLFELRRVQGQGASPLSLPVECPDGWEWVPSEKARLLVAYLLTQDKSAPVPSFLAQERREFMPRGAKSFVLPGKPRGPVLSPEESLRREGARVFTAQCAVCHGPDGTGDGFNYPPVSGSEYMSLPPADLAEIVLRGLKGPVKVKGRVWDNYMTPLGPRLSDREIAAVLTYVLKEFAPERKENLSEDMISAWRRVSAGLPPVKGEELTKKMPKKD